jgi:Ser/Thr protein kinase RdoA (MazF antagonist)
MNFSMALAHGMDGGMAARDWPALSVAELAPVLSAYPEAGAVRAVTWQSPRPFAASGIVACAGGDVFVKRHAARVRGVADLAEEHAFLRHLRAAGAAVPRVLARGDGRTVSEVGGWSYEVHAVAGGVDSYRNDVSWTPVRGVAQAEALGRALGALNKAAVGFDAPVRRTGLLVGDFRVFLGDDPLGTIGDRAAWRAALAGRDWRADFSRVLLPWHAALQSCGAVLPPLWTHNDFHVSNLMWHADGRVACVVDFGLANRTCAVFDVATAIERNAVAWLEGDGDIGRPALARGILRGYRAVCDADLGALRHVMPLVHVEFALSELAYFHGVTRSAANAELAYGDFLLGHAAWFGTRFGQEFLDAIA